MKKLKKSMIGRTALAASATAVFAATLTGCGVSFSASW